MACSPLILGILAIVYSVKTRAYTSFKRGLFLSALLFVIQMLNTYNLIPVFKSEGMSQTGILGMMIFYAVYSLIFSALLYFSLVGARAMAQRRAQSMAARQRTDTVIMCWTA